MHFLRVNFANCEATPCKKILTPFNARLVSAGRGVVLGVIRRNQNHRCSKQLFGEAGECCKSTHRAMLDEFTTYQVDGSVVDYRAFDG